MPAATAASMPGTLSSTTAVRRRVEAHPRGGVQEQVGRRLAGRDLGGAEDPSLEALPQPGRRSVTAILWCGPLEATHDGSAMRSSAAITPGTASSSRAKTASTSA